MSQLSFGDAEFSGKRKQTRRERFLAEMDQVVPWKELEKVIKPFYPTGDKGRAPYPLSTMLRIHFMQNWFGLSDLGMEDELYEVASVRQFAGLSLNRSIPDETTILNFRHLLEENDLAEDLFNRVNAYLSAKRLLLKRGSMVDATLIAAPSSTKNAEGKRDPEMHQTKKGNQWYFGMKAHVGADSESGLVHTLVTTPANEADIEVAEDLLHGKESVVYADAGYTGADKRSERRDLDWKIAAKRGRIKALPEGRMKRSLEAAEKRKASIRAKVEHCFRVIKCQFGFTKVRFKGLAKNTAQLFTLFALSNLYMVRKHLRRQTGSLRPAYGNG